MLTGIVALNSMIGLGVAVGLAAVDQDLLRVVAAGRPVTLPLAVVVGRPLELLGAARGMINSWFSTARPLTSTAEIEHRPDHPLGADPGGEHRQQLVVLLHPGDGEDRRHHADHAAEPVVELAHVDQVVPAHDPEQLDRPVGAFENSSRLRERVDDDVQADQRE